MDRLDTVLLAAYLVAGLIALGCGFVPGPRSVSFRVWCVLLGTLISSWPAWMMMIGDWGLPRQVRFIPLALPVVLLAATVTAAVRERKSRERRQRDQASTLPEVDDDPELNVYPGVPPFGDMSDAHDPWKALYASLEYQRTKWRAAAEPERVEAEPEPEPAAPRGLYRGRHR